MRIIQRPNDKVSYLLDTFEETSPHISGVKNPFRVSDALLETSHFPEKGLQSNIGTILFGLCQGSFSGNLFYFVFRGYC